MGNKEFRELPYTILFVNDIKIEYNKKKNTETKEFQYEEYEKQLLE